MKTAALALALALLPGVALAQTTAPAVQPAAPVFTWKIVLKNLLNHIERVRPEQYPDYGTCEAARHGMGEADLHIFGVHGDCVYVPTTYN
jgi:hypothetical protein